MYLSPINYFLWSWNNGHLMVTGWCFFYKKVKKKKNNPVKENKEINKSLFLGTFMSTFTALLCELCCQSIQVQYHLHIYSGSPMGLPFVCIENRNTRPLPYPMWFARLPSLQPCAPCLYIFQHAYSWMGCFFSVSHTFKECDRGRIELLSQQDVLNVYPTCFSMIKHIFMS